MSGSKSFLVTIVTWRISGQGHKHLIRFSRFILFKLAARLVQVAVRKKNKLTIICRYERAAKSKSERGLVSEARQSEQTATCFLWHAIIIPCI